jgi:DNA-binding NtrC family response regulator
LSKKIKTGEFREDFFYRLNVLPIKMPALRDRVEDIPLIANHLLEKHCVKLGKPVKRLSPELMDAFTRLRWEGNVREMENLIIQGILFSNTDEITPEHVRLGNKPASGALADTTPLYDQPYKHAKESNLQAFNSAYIGHMLTLSKGNVTQAAKSCGLERQALQQIMRRYGITAEPYRQ